MSDEDEREREGEEADFLQDFIFNEENPWRQVAGRSIVSALQFIHENWPPDPKGLVVRQLVPPDMSEEELKKAWKKPKSTKAKAKTRKRRAKKQKREEPEREPPNPVEGTIIDLAKNVIIQAAKGRSRAKRWSDEDTDYEKDKTEFPEGLRIREKDKEDGAEEHLTELHKHAGVKWVPESGEGRRFRHVRQELRDLLRQEDMTDEFNRDFNVSV